ncbi:hypothetical protein RUM44_010253 [Polyplax serrata]|uniref:Uncharacterized protein n=1 Tax=Polyplax serrata TaxID=468196 RepID=A0ABR1AV16_POLSC
MLPQVQQVSLTCATFRLRHPPPSGTRLTPRYAELLVPHQNVNRTNIESGTFLPARPPFTTSWTRKQEVLPFSVFSERTQKQQDMLRKLKEEQSVAEAGEGVPKEVLDQQLSTSFDFSLPPH